MSALDVEEGTLEEFVQESEALEAVELQEVADLRQKASEWLWEFVSIIRWACWTQREQV